MSHLPTERLAALADAAPTADELAHLASCELCARERAIYAGLLVSASEEYSRIGAPLTRWEKLRPALIADGVIDAGGVLSFRERRWFGKRGAWQAAAALLLVVGGFAAGRVSTATAGASRFASGATPGAGVVQVASNPESMTFTSVAEAREARRVYESLFQSASAYLAANDTAALTPDTPAALRMRFATLDRVEKVVREAMPQAPADPVINGYYLTTLGQKEAALQQLNASLPSSARVIQF
jgi:hypothetical protein